MADRKLRRILRKYIEERSPENAVTFVEQYLRIYGAADDPLSINDMDVADFDLSEIENIDEKQDVYEWLDSAASFNHVDHDAYEVIVFIGNIDPESDITFDNFRLNRVEEPTPADLIPPIVEAYQQGYKYICFYN